MILAEKKKYQWNRTESPEISPPCHGQLISNKGGKNIQRGKAIYSINRAGKIVYIQKNETRAPPCTTHRNKFNMDKRLK